ncbi:M3 family metallopeptidase [Methylovirgula sp. 4M-Z18]|uniref:M3 family metallopeptidase n=1 Tax=Methylovirgula sp. 4M-Z18 TaxID=2293567 RepID=UPI000E2E5416|nr:M3 family metallopeptidase [Methylovirgula sp. 4M-Z18]RFB79714.1 M3 family peptidase [Methylovirgula sp. 4M-Z18]
MSASTNPLLRDWDTPFGLPPFAEIEPSHFKPAFDEALATHKREIAAIADNPALPSFANTIDALELAGHALDQVNSVFWNLTGTHTNPAIQAVELEISPILARHGSDIYMDAKLFARVDAVYEQMETLGLSGEQKRVLGLTHKAFIRSGAQLDEAKKARMAEILQRLAELRTQFGQNLLKDEASWTLELSDDDLAGLPDSLIEDARRTAEDHGLADKRVVTLQRSSIEPFLQFSARRDLREIALQAFVSRGAHEGATDNRPIVAEMVRLRAEQAQLLGFDTFADFKLEDSMAKTPQAVRGLLDAVWSPAKVRAADETQALAKIAAREGQSAPIAPHDWRYYANKLRKELHDLDEATLKPYLQLDNIVEAAFETARRLFGLDFVERKDVTLYHPDARAWEVMDKSGKHIGLFIGDYFARPSKHSGAWMNAIRLQKKLGGDTRPIILNVMTFNKGAEGKPALLSFDDAKTVFHEFGHGLHGLLSDVTYPLLSGTNVPRDFVEFPSQLYEHWLMQPEILRRYAVHVDTGAPLPDELVERLRAARNFNQGFATVEYSSSAIVDMEFHSLRSAANLDPVAFEAETLQQIGMPREILMRHSMPHFTHVFAGDGYCAGYYSYLWSEVLDADGFAAFEEAGDIFDPELAGKLKTFVYSAGASRDPEEAYKLFRGRAPTIDALLHKRGLVAAAA